MVSTKPPPKEHAGRLVELQVMLSDACALLGALKSPCCSMLAERRGRDQKGAKEAAARFEGQLTERRRPRSWSCQRQSGARVPRDRFARFLDSHTRRENAEHAQHSREMSLIKPEDLDVTATYSLLQLQDIEQVNTPYPTYLLDLSRHAEQAQVSPESKLKAGSPHVPRYSFSTTLRRGVRCCCGSSLRRAWPRQILHEA